MIELPEPLDLGSSQDLLRAFNTYKDAERAIWDDVAGDLVRGTPQQPQKAAFPERFVLRPEGGTVKDVLQ